MKFKKAQMDIRELILTIVLAGILFIVGLLIFSNVTNTASGILDKDVNTVTNESVTISSTDLSVVNESITITSGVGATTNSPVTFLSFFGNATNNTDSVEFNISLHVNYTTDGAILVSQNATSTDANETPFGDGIYNISYIHTIDSIGTAANSDITQITEFSNATIGLEIEGISTDLQVNITGASSNIIRVSGYNFSDGDYNTSYTHTSDTASQTTINNLETTVLDSFELGVIALIVLAAVVILTVLFKLGQ
ncbi:hypothetical protein LCGC14_2716480 [marine sediment metagenome]|uniref:Uncharacterized protein n=1 Tax=marine sediment metagenome TaxID=412755 RepID=A0A0F8ZBA7_9ZZZZ